MSSSLRISMFRKVRCRIQSRTSNTNLITFPLSMVSSKQQPIKNFLNESQNCAEKLLQHPSLIDIDISNNEYSEEQLSSKSMKQSINFSLRKHDIKSKNGGIHLHCRSLIKPITNDSSLAISSHSFHYHRNQIQKCLCLSTSSIHRQTSDSIIFVHRNKHDIKHQHYITSKQQPLSNSTSHNINSMTYDSSLSDTTINTPSSNSDILTPITQKNDKTWRLKINDDLNKDGSRHSVIHRGSEESIRKRRQDKRDKRPEEKKRRIEERVVKANERWQKYSSIDYELVFFISRYYDQLPLCSNCRNYFTTHQTQSLADDPRASLDYAADAVLHSPNNKTMTMKQAAKSKLIQDYDKQTDIIFNLCDTCLTKCEQIRNELKQINFAKKMSNESNSPNISKTEMTTPEPQQQPIASPSFSPTISPLMSPSPLNTNIIHQQTITPTSHQNITTDLNQIYMNNVIQNHHIKLQQLYQQSQNIIVAQQYQENYPLTTNQQQLHHDLRSCIKQMQYHYLEILHHQYPGYPLSFPYTPSYNPQCISYRNQEIDDDDYDDENNNDTQNSSLSSEDEDDTPTDDNRSSPAQYDENQRSFDDRLTIETCYGLVEYCNAPLDDFIRGLQVLKCLSNFNCYSS